MTRNGLLTFLSKRGIVAEIGVARGAFSESIIRACEPIELHLIDPWQQIPDAPNAHLDPHNVPNDQAELRYNAVCEKFRGRAIIHRGMSWDVLPQFPDDYFDWVYIDGDHRYEAIKRDLELCARKSRIIAGHDYTESCFARSLCFGVKRAVDEFLLTGEWVMTHLTEEDFPSYVLERVQ